MACKAQYEANKHGFVLLKERHTVTCLRCEIITTTNGLNARLHQNHCIHHQSKVRIIRGCLHVTLLPGSPDGQGGPEVNEHPPIDEPRAKRSRSGGGSRDSVGLCKICMNKIATKQLYPCHCVCLCHECFETIPITADEPLLCPGRSCMPICGEKTHSFMTVPIGLTHDLVNDSA